MTDGLWRTAAISDEEIQSLMDVHGLPRRVAMWARLYGLDEHTFQDWTQPEAMSWSSPYDFHQMERAVMRIRHAIGSGHRIVVVGDYDVDGVSASTILCSGLAQLGADWRCLLPHRVADGYGLSIPMVDRALDLGCKLLVTVDNGIAAGDAVAYACTKGIDVIVTDHHAPGDAIPTEAFALVHWADSQHPEAAKHLSGAGVAWKLVEALTEGMTDPDDTNHRWMRDWRLGLAAMAALADVMPMSGENRKLVRRGLVALGTCNRPGWLALCERANVSPLRPTEQAVLWNIVPRLNAAGRMDSAEIAFQLLMAADKSQADTLADMLEALNQKRRAETELATMEALAQCKPDRNLDDEGIVVAGAWHLGVVGIVAAKLTETLARPVIVLADDGGSVLRGSGRAPEGFPLHGAVSACTTWLHHFGGHDGAIGCAVPREHVDAFTQAFREACAGLQMDDAPGPDTAPVEEAPAMVPVADDWLSVREVGTELLAWLNRFRPFGAEAPEPCFFVGPMTIHAIHRLSGGKHLRLQVQEDKEQTELLWFQATEMATTLRVGGLIAAVVTLSENEWRGRTSVQLRVKRLIPLANPVTRSQFGRVFMALRQHESATIEDLCRALSSDSVEAIEMVLTSFVELGFAAQVGNAYHVNKQAVSRDLRESASYQRHLWLQIKGD